MSNPFCDHNFRVDNFEDEEDGVIEVKEELLALLGLASGKANPSVHL